MNGHFKPMTYLEKHYLYFTNNITKKEHIVINNVQFQQNNVFVHNKLKRHKEKISKIISNDKKNKTSNAYIIWTKDHDEVLQNIMKN